MKQAGVSVPFVHKDIAKNLAKDMRNYYKKVRVSLLSSGMYLVKWHGLKNMVLGKENEG